MALHCWFSDPTFFPFSFLDPWLIRKEHKKIKEKKKKKSIDPDSIQSALLASGLGSKRPSSLSSTAVISTATTTTSGMMSRRLLNWIDSSFQ